MIFRIYINKVALLNAVKPEAPAKAEPKYKERPFTMKLHNLLLTAALFLAVGIVSATEEDPVD